MLSKWQSKLSVLVLVSGLLLSPASNLFAKQYSDEVSNLLARGDEYLVNQDQPKEACKYYQQAIDLDKQCPHAYNQLGLCYSHLGRVLDAIEQYKKALEIDAKFIPSLVNLGSAYYRNNKYTEAIGYYKKASELRKDKDPEILANIASVVRDRGTFEQGANKDADFEEAESYYRKAIAIKDNFAQARNNYALLLLRQKHYASAKEEVDKAISIKPEYAMAYYNLGLIEEAQNNIPKAIEAYRKSLQFETVPAYKDDTSRKIASLGGTLVSQKSDVISKSYNLILQKKWPEAEELLSRAVTGKERNNPIAWNNYGFVLAKLDSFAPAISAYRTAIKLKPTHFPAAHYNLGQLLLSKGELEDAQKCLEEAINQAEGRHALAHNALAIVLKQQGNLKKAMEHYYLAITQSGNALPVAHFNRALLLEKQGLAAEAATEYKIYLELAPDGYNAGIARKKLAQNNQKS